MQFQTHLFASLALAIGASAASAQFPLDLIERVDADPFGTVATLPSRNVSISTNGRYAIFSTYAQNLVADDTNYVEDVYVRDLRTGAISRVSMTPAGTQLSKPAMHPSISGDGRFVTFETVDATLVPGDTNGVMDVFVCDTTDGSVERASVMTGGGEADGISCESVLSSDGLFVAFASDAPCLCGDGPHVAKGGRHIFLRDRVKGRTWRASIGPLGTEIAARCAYPTVSAHGQFVAFEARNLTLEVGMPPGSSQIYVFDRAQDKTILVSRDDFGTAANGDCTQAVISNTGRYVAFSSVATNLVAGDTNGVMDVFIHDLKKGITRRISLDSLGNQTNGKSYAPSLSETGRFVAFTSLATNLTTHLFGGDRAVYVRDNDLGVTQLMSMNSDAVAANDFALTTTSRTLSGDGRYSVFESFATNLVPNSPLLGIGCYRFDRMSYGPRLEWSPPIAGERTTLEASGATPLGPMVVAISAAGQGPVPTFWGLVDLSLPVELFVTYADVRGNAKLQWIVPLAASGSAIYAQAIDIFGVSHTNPLAAPVL